MIDFLVLCGKKDEALNFLKTQLIELNDCEEKSFSVQSMLIDVKMRIEKITA